MYRPSMLRGLTLHTREFSTSPLFCRHYTAMVGDQGATTPTGPAQVKPKDNTMREVKILMLHGKHHSDEGVAMSSYLHLLQSLT
jgi:hypothetical protein